MPYLTRVCKTTATNHTKPVDTEESTGYQRPRVGDGERERVKGIRSMVTNGNNFW